MLPLQGKKILYIGVSTFGYEKVIKSGLESMGAKVDYYDERPSNTFWTKVLLRLGLKLLIKSNIDSYYSFILNKIKSISYDFVFIIKLETIDKNILEKLKANQPNASFLLYLWDSIQNYKGKELLLPFFDRSFSFDINDTKKFKLLVFLPLFYSPTYTASTTKKVIKYDLCFIGTGHTDRYNIVKKIKVQASDKNLKVFTFFYLQSKLIYLFKKIFDKKMKSSKVADFSFSSLTQAQVFAKIMESNIIIDIEHPKQVGLTMRTIEMLGCQKKLLTTNQSIKEYDFFDKQNICIIDRANPILSNEFLNKPYKIIDKDIYKKYSLNSWLKTIFSCE